MKRYVALLHRRRTSRLRGQAIWADYAGGVARCKLTPAVLDRAFGSSVTMRNFKTLRALVAMGES